MKFDAVEARLYGPASRVGEQPGQDLGQRADMVEVYVGDALAIAERERLQLAVRENATKLGVAQSGQRRTHLALGRGDEAPVAGQVDERLAVRLAQLQEAREVLRRIGAPADGKEVDQLDEQPRPPTTATPDLVGELP